MNRTGRVTAAGAIGLAGVVMLGVMTHAAAVGQDSAAEEGRDALVEVLGRGAHLNRGLAFDEMTDLLPNVKYQTPKDKVSVSEVVVHGKVTSVEPAFGYYVPEDPKSPDGVQLPFNDARAMWRTVTLHVDVLDTLGDGADVGSNIKVGLALAGSVQLGAVRKGFESLESSIFVLRKGSPVFGYDKSIYADVLDGALIAEVREGKLFLPGFEAQRPGAGGVTDEQMLERTSTVTDLKREAERPSTTRSVPVG